MNFDEILGKLMPLFEQKMAFNMEMSKRAMSLEEKKEASKTDLEYRKLEAQITSDKDKLKWEKEKLTTAVKADYDLQTLKNSGMLDSERLKQIGEKEKQKIMEDGANSRAKLNADTESSKTYLTTLGTILGHAQEVSQTGLDGQTKTSRPTTEVVNAARSLMEQTGLARPTATPQGRNVAGEAEVAAGVLREHEKAGTPDSARNYLNSLPADTRQATLALLNPGTGAATLATGVAPASPSLGVRTPLPAAEDRSQVQPVPDAARPTTQPTGGPAGSPVTAGRFIQGYSPRALQNMTQDEYIKNRKATNFTKPAQDAEEEKRRALRRARGLTIGGSL